MQSYKTLVNMEDDKEGHFNQHKILFQLIEFITNLRRSYKFKTLRLIKSNKSNVSVLFQDP